MIRQLPKLSLPSFLTQEEKPDIKVYDIITGATQLNAEGNSMQLQLFQKDSEVNEGVRELHGTLVLNTTQLPDHQDLKFGFLFSEDPNSGRYDGVQVMAKVDMQNLKPSFKFADVHTTERPDVFARESDFGVIQKDEQNDWSVSKSGQGNLCDENGRCQFSISFVRNFNTLDEKDIALEVGEEREYSVIGFYEASDFESGEVTHVGQSNDIYVFAEAYSAISCSSLALATAIFALASF